ncbi:MAG: hypothetical protein KDD69_02310 [Bdellovibrionales bacterium]|nr:hypothetical protein [Bdellovibrionales bacterium]
MGLRSTIILALLPVFLMLGLLSAFIEHYLVEQELQWGLEEKNRNVALGIASFLDESTAEMTPEIRDERLQNMELLLEHPGVLGIAYLEPTNGTALRIWGDEQLRYGISAQDLPNVAEGMIAASTGAAAEPHVSAIYPVRSNSGYTVGLLQVFIDARPMEVALGNLRQQLYVRVLAIGAIALPIGWVLASLLRRRIKRSVERAAAILADPTPEPLRSSGIRELDDVNEMVEILAALLEERLGSDLLPAEPRSKRHVRSPARETSAPLEIAP